MVEKLEEVVQFRLVPRPCFLLYGEAFEATHLFADLLSTLLGAGSFQNLQAFAHCFFTPQRDGRSAGLSLVDT